MRCNEIRRSSQSASSPKSSSALHNDYLYGSQHLYRSYYEARPPSKTRSSFARILRTVHSLDQLSHR